MRPLLWLWLWLELYAFHGRRARAAARLVPWSLDPPSAAARGCNCSVCQRGRVAA